MRGCKPPYNVKLLHLDSNFVMVSWTNCKNKTDRWSPVHSSRNVNEHYPGYSPALFLKLMHRLLVTSVFHLKYACPSHGFYSSMPKWKFHGRNQNLSKIWQFQNIVNKSTFVIGLAFFGLKPINFVSSPLFILRHLAKYQRICVQSEYGWDKRHENTPMFCVMFFKKHHSQYWKFKTV